MDPGQLVTRINGKKSYSVYYHIYSNNLIAPLVLSVILLLYVVMT